MSFWKHLFLIFYLGVIFRLDRSFKKLSIVAVRKNTKRKMIIKKYVCETTSYSVSNKILTPFLIISKKIFHEYFLELNPRALLLFLELKFRVQWAFRIEKIFLNMQALKNAFVHIPVWYLREELLKFVLLQSIFFRIHYIECKSQTLSI